MADKRRTAGRCRHCDRELGGPGPLARHEELCGSGKLATRRMHVVMTDGTHGRLALLAERSGLPAWKVIGLAVHKLTIAEACASARKEKS